MRRRPLRRRRGFTLVELMISLVMGVIIALAVVALARTATTTFHEQARLSSVEMALRSASERLRGDLAKVSYMSTGNILHDPRIARRSNGTTSSPTAIATTLRGVQILVGAGQARTEGTMGLASAQSTPLVPDEIIVTGNLRSDDVYRGQWVGSGTCGGAGAQIRLNALADPAVARLFNGATSSADIVRNVQSVFMPGSVLPTPVVTEYIVQVMDPRGCFNYLAICGVEPGTSPNTVLLSLHGDGAESILTPADTGGDQCGGRLMEEFAIAPVHRVHWFLASSTDTRLYDNVTELTGANKFNLYRELLDVSGAPVGAPELVAEYGIDLKFGIVADDSLRSPAPGNLLVYELDRSAAEIETWAGATLSPTRTMPGPQRIRSIRYRVALRSALPERTADIPVFAGSSNGLFRYCTDTTVAPCRKYARVRSLVSEVALINQSRFFY